MEIISNFHDDFTEIILKRIEYLKKLDFKFIEYDKWKRKKLRRFQNKVKQKESCGEGANFEKDKSEEKVLYNEYCKDIVHHYFNLAYKIPEKRPRKILRCTNFLCPKELENGLSQLEERIIKGDDLLPYLSREIFDPTYRDFLLYDFGIVHFHLGTKPAKDNPLLIEGTTELVYAFIDNNSCYFIKIGDHDKWDDKELLITLKKDFPQVLNKWKIKGKPVIILSNEERKDVIKGCINTLIEIDGEYYMSPGMGMNTAGTSALAVMNMNRNFNNFIYLQEYIKQEIKQNLEDIEETLGGKLIDMHLILQEAEPVIIHEPNNNLHILITSDEQKFSMKIENNCGTWYKIYRPA